MKKMVTIVLTLAVVFTLVGCAAAPNEMANQPGEEGEVAGFWTGLWHGFISFFTFIISLFSDKVGVYEVHNNGGWYNFGFIFGVMMFYGGGGGGACKRSRR